MLFKGFSIFSSGSHFVYRSGTILAILVWNQLGIIPVKSESKSTKSLAFIANYLRFSISSSGGHFVHLSETVFAILLEDHLSNIPMKFD